MTPLLAVLILVAFLLGRLSRVFQTEPLLGLGDVVALITATLFISATGNCGCKQRRERWNRDWPLPSWLQKRTATGGGQSPGNV